MVQTGFVGVFEEKFKKLLKKIEKEYEKPKQDRNKAFLKNTAKEARQLRKLLRECKEQMGEACCPNCGHHL